MLFNETILNVSKWQISIGSAARTEFTFLYYNLNSLSSHINAKNLWNQNKEAKFQTFRSIFAKPRAFDERSRASPKWTLNCRHVCMIVCLQQQQQQTTTTTTTTTNWPNKYLICRSWSISCYLLPQCQNYTGGNCHRSPMTPSNRLSCLRN